jgi:hypothetical protein
MSAVHKCVVGLLVLAASVTPAAAQTWTSVGSNGPGNFGRVFVAPSSGTTALTTPGDDAAGGVFRTTNSGDSWLAVSAGLCDLHVITMAIDPTTPTTFYVGTMAGGVCRTTDAGATWTALRTGLPGDVNGFPQAVNAIAINPATPTILLAGTPTGIYVSTNGGANWAAPSGTGGSFIQSVVIAPSNSAIAYASSDNGIFKTTDSGATWTLATTGIPSVSTGSEGGTLAVDPTQPNTVYLVRDDVYKTTTGGTSWATSNSGLAGAFFLGNIAIDPVTPSVLYLNAPGGCGLCKSTDNGGTWTAIGAGLPSYLGFPNVITSVTVDPTTSSRLYATSPFGVYRSTDSGANWTGINSALSVTSITAFGLGGATPATAYIATRSQSSSADMARLAGGILPFATVTSPFTTDGSGRVDSLVVDPTDPNVIYADGGKIAGQNCPQPYKTTNGGTSWTAMASGIPATLCGSALTMDRSAPGTLYLAGFNSASSVGLYKTTNGGTSWSASNTGITGSVNRVTVSPLNSTILYAASGNSVFRSANAGATWSSVSSGLPSGGTTFLNLMRVAIDPTNDNIVYAATARGVYVTTNGGGLWTARNTGGWPSLNGVKYSAFALAIDPTTPTTVYASPATPAPGPIGFLGTNALGAGLFRSTDSGATWTSIPELAGSAVFDVQIDGTRATFASTSTGVFRFAAALPTMTLDRTSLAFSAVTTGTAFSSKTATQTVRIAQSGAGTVTWTAASSSPWLVVSPVSGSGSVTLSVSVQFASALAPSQPGSITLTFTGANNAAGPVNVTLSTLTTTSALAPAGNMDTPVDGTTGVAGSIPVTGWAIDDVGVARVSICRDGVAGEAVPAHPLCNGLAKIYIGDGLFLDGARGDIQALYPNAPFNTRAGWGYLMLTNFLPSGGNGVFNLYAYATDVDGHTSQLGGPKTITCSNATSIAPFGSIDSPGQGEVIGGAVYNNFGWALSPGLRRADVPGGGLTRVFVDSTDLGTPGGWVARADLQALFPKAQYDGVDNALAVKAIDTTILANGLHTIAWIVTGNSGGTSGVGSRYFTVSNGSGLLLGSSRASMAASPSGVTLAAEIDAAPADRSAIAGRRGFDLNTPLTTYPFGGQRVTVASEELDRVELLLGAAGEYQYTGYLRTVAGPAPLPIGSSMDAATGAFGWMPGVGFVGNYDFVFVQWGGGRAVSRREVRIVLNPKTSNRLGPQVIIDAPAARSGGGAIVVGRAFFLAGWAVDLDSLVDGGVDTVHVWAYPVNAAGQREDPIFLGPAIYGNARPDVAAVYGERFKDSGYGMIVRDLAPGTYDVALFAYSTVSNGFAPAKIVRVTVR